MLNVTLLNGLLLLSNINWQLVTSGLVPGLIAFFFLFLLIRTLEKENIYKFNLKAIAKKLKFVKYSNAVMLVKDGVLQLNQLQTAQVSPQQVYEAMRSKQISNLAQIERLFLVSGSEFSIYKKEETPAEIPVYQYTEKELVDQQGKA